MLYLVQHGQATTEEQDPERPLTEVGVTEVAAVVQHGIERAGVRASRVVHSGKTRARQTAEAWAARLGVDAEESDGLAPNDDPATWAGRLAGTSEALMLVGHLPHLSRLCALLIRGVPEPPVVLFRPGGLVGLERTDAAWAVALVLPPAAA